MNRASNLIVIIFVILIVYCIIQCISWPTAKVINGGGPMNLFRTTNESKYDKPKHNKQKGDNPVPIFGTIEKGHKKGKDKNLAKKLTNAGWVLYSKKSCPWCHIQIDMFGDDKKYLKIVDCSETDLRPEEFRQCSQTWVYPTWVNRNMVLPGSQSFMTLNDALKDSKNAITLEQYKNMKR